EPPAARFIASAAELRILPFPRQAGGSEDQLDDLAKGGLGAHVIAEQDDAAATALQTDPFIAGPVVMAAVEDARPLRPGEGSEADPRAQGWPGLGRLIRRE